MFGLDITNISKLAHNINCDIVLLSRLKYNNIKCFYMINFQANRWNQNLFCRFPTHESGFFQSRVFWWSELHSLGRQGWSYACCSKVRLYPRPQISPIPTDPIPEVGNRIKLEWNFQSRINNLYLDHIKNSLCDSFMVYVHWSWTLENSRIF